MDRNEILDFQDRLLQWFWANRRTMPWREEPSPYRIWISEVMLQQTRVETVIPYFQRFLAKYPTVADLARSDEEELLKQWEGLGYYSRARNLRHAAQEILERFQGEVPQTFEDLRTLKGIGEYTAGAVASMAFGQRVPAVDGNVYRVMARVTGCREDIAQGKTQKLLKAETRNVLPDHHVGDFNQALMELGATVCIPKGAPKCGQCPVKDHCEAFRETLQEEIPVKGKAKERRQEERTVLILEQAGCYAVRRREEPGILHGLYELPNVSGYYSKEEIQAMLAEKGMTALAMTALPEQKIVFSHLEWHLEGYQVKLKEEGGGYRFAPLQEIRESFSVASAFQGYLTLLENEENAQKAEGGETCR